ncbi:DUF418 domain-containing protein [Heyndrickxia oleronia]|uniref:DUF418 domain-containing protein n=1 Tax=Heyndrickxia oleronia TaxID=38875 RepID=UPI00203A72C9|nr:DUF418 domain-containing protein [Heyndrickxia oleronia]MCM3240313.1 DUF418 domain-containing protein [Heyndrickxia oleronia]
MNSIEQTRRIDALDYLRGFALIGIILVNILALLSVQMPEPHTANAAYQKWLYLFVETRFFSIFSFLFGVGFYIFLSRAISKGKNGYVLFIRRIIALFIFGCIHHIFQPGEALAVYAICGLLVMPFYKVKKEINLIVGLVLLITFAILSIKELMSFPYILLGLAAGQYRIFEKLSEQKRLINKFTFVMFLLSIVGLTYQYMQSPLRPFYGMILEGTDDLNVIQTNKFLKIGIMIGPIVSAFYVGLVIILVRVGMIAKLLSPIKNLGRMALSNYIMQTTFILLANVVLHLNNKITYLETLYLCLIILVLQLIYSTIWLRFFKFGPLEWIWRMVTYLKIMPLRKVN